MCSEGKDWLALVGSLLHWTVGDQPPLCVCVLVGLTLREVVAARGADGSGYTVERL